MFFKDEHLGIAQLGSSDHFKSSRAQEQGMFEALEQIVTTYI